MSKKMTDREFAQKLEWEGVLYGLLDYGLKSEDLENQDGELFAAMKRFEKLKPELKAVLNELESLMEDVLEE